jgi:hypothetical protein
VVGRQLTGLVKALDARFGQGPGALQARWRDVVGPELARRTEPVRVVKPRGPGAKDQPAALELRVAPGAAVVVQHQAAEILARANLLLGPGAVGKLRIVQGPVKPRPDLVRKPDRSSRRSVAAPLDAAAEAELEATLAGAKDEQLKAALARLGRAVSRSNQRA